MKTETISGTEYTFAPIKLGVGRKLKDKYPASEDYNIAFIAESLKAGGMPEASFEWVEENVNFYDTVHFVRAAFGANGIEIKVPTPGEEMPPGQAA